MPAHTLSIPPRDRVEEEGSRAGKASRGRWVRGSDRRCNETPGTGASEGDSRTSIRLRLISLSAYINQPLRWEYFSKARWWSVLFEGGAGRIRTHNMRPGLNGAR